MLIHLFPGQGSQQKGMGAKIFSDFPDLIQQANDILGYSITTLCLEDPDNKLNQTQYTQPALYTVNVLSYEAEIMRDGNMPDFCAGHSLGEYNALYAAGALSFADGLKLVKKRGELMSRAQQGAMAAILNIDAESIKQCLLDNNLPMVNIANYNTASQLVISGLQQDIAMAKPPLEAAGAMFIPLNTSGAFHSDYMMDARQAFSQYLEGFSFSKLRCPVIANVTALPYEQNNIAATLAHQITGSVRWQASIEYLLSLGGSDFKELGTGTILSKMVDKIKKDYTPPPVKHTAVSAVKTPVTINPEQRINDWNAHYPVGTPVKVRGYQQPLETKTKAVVLFGHRAAVYMKNYNGYFDLDDVEPA